jgi:hypothetical protein
MDEQRWFRHLLDVCRSELEDAESGLSPGEDDDAVELRLIVQGSSVDSRLDSRQWFSVRGTGRSCLAMVERDTRREQNQKLFRIGNERLDDAVEGRLPDDATVPFLCECADLECGGRVELRRSQWGSIAAKPNHFVMVAGHPRSEGEVIVGDIDEYDVVRKPG